MKIPNIDNKIVVIKENYSECETTDNLRQYAENAADNDPNFFRWLFGHQTEFLGDFENPNVDEFNDFLNQL